MSYLRKQSIVYNIPACQSVILSPYTDFFVINNRYKSDQSTVSGSLSWLFITLARCLIRFIACCRRVLGIECRSVLVILLVATWG